MTDAQALRRPLALGQRPGPATANLTDRELLDRFLRQQDKTAFAALVQRHGPMVLGLCRRILDHEQDAEDAFQATFLILVRRAGSIANPDLLGSWLYGVAYRTARKARTQAARRRKQERQVASVTAAEEPPVDHAWRELRSALDAELNRLPDKYRLPLVLCYLEGLTNEEAARRLGWPAGSMSYRLARGREMLRDRMQGRNRQAPAGFFALVLALRPDGGPLPGHLVHGTVQAGFAGGQAGVVSGKVAALVDATLRGMAAARRKLLHTLFILLGALAVSVGATVFYSSETASPAPFPDASESNTQNATQGSQPTAVRGTDCRSP
ncbi:MAG: sigma-70 family RNA polymerase sigma factor [Planctomycetes bacterium]|nr:sigma-70 family RNA polymerase sigma factor [Planctomycetota bacterium]